MVNKRNNRAYGLNNPLQDVFPEPVKAQRAPTSSDTGYEIGQAWIDQPNNISYILTGVSSNSATWQITGFSNSGAFPITPYVVGSSGEAGYTTIQSAITAAVAGGGGVVYIQPGTYTEDLTLASGVHLCSLPYSEGTSVIIDGTHTPPSTGSVILTQLRLNDASAIFSSAAAGTAEIYISECNFTVTSGHTFDLANWIGAIQCRNCDSLGTNDGVINNTGGASLIFTSSTIGAGSSNSMITSSSVTLDKCNIQAPFNPQTGSNVLADHSNFSQSITLANDTTGYINGSKISTGANVGLTMSSSGNFSMSNVIVDSTNNPAIDGAGAGTLTLTGMEFVNNSTIAATLTTAGGNSTTGSVTAFDGDISASRAEVGGDVLVQSINTDNTNIGSNSGVVIQTGGTLAGSPYMQFELSGGQLYTMGINNAATNDDFIISDGALGVGNVVEIDGTTGDVNITNNLTLDGGGARIGINGGAVTDFIGSATLAAGTVTVANTNISANDKIYLSYEGTTLANTGNLSYTISAATSFTIESTNGADANTVSYIIFRQI